MLSRDSFEYAIENTEVIHAPARRIETFGTTTFRFFLVSELMDNVNQVRVRDGRIHAERPQIVTPGWFHRNVLEGFGEKAGEFIDWMRANKRELTIMKYGFSFKKTDISEEVVHCSMEDVIGRLRERVDGLSGEDCAVIQGVDEGWEVCLLKFTADLIQGSAMENLGELRRRGLIE